MPLGEDIQRVDDGDADDDDNDDDHPPTYIRQGAYEPPLGVGHVQVAFRCRQHIRVSNCLYYGRDQKPSEQQEVLQVVET